VGIRVVVKVRRVSAAAGAASVDRSISAPGRPIVRCGLWSIFVSFSAQAQQEHRIPAAQSASDQDRALKILDMPWDGAVK
jgi:hypothetical protein